MTVSAACYYQPVSYYLKHSEPNKPCDSLKVPTQWFATLSWEDVISTLRAYYYQIKVCLRNYSKTNIFPLHQWAEVTSNTYKIGCFKNGTIYYQKALNSQQATKSKSLKQVLCIGSSSQTPAKVFSVEDVAAMKVPHFLTLLLDHFWHLVSSIAIQEKSVYAGKLQ